MEPDVSCLPLLKAGALSEPGRLLYRGFSPPAQLDKPWLNLKLSELKMKDASTG